MPGKYNYKRPVRTILFVISAWACITDSYAQNGNAYSSRIENWHKNRIERLKAEDGWLNLVGLYWLPEGKSSFGTGSQNNIVFPAGTITSDAGYFEKQGDRVQLYVSPGTTIQVNGNSVNQAVLFSNDSGKAALAASGSLRWTIIKRGDRLGIRLRDLNSTNLKEFKGIERFPVDSIWKIQARLLPADKIQIPITNIIGQTNLEKTAGRLVFNIYQHVYTLDALEEGDQLFVLFGDSSNGLSTYPSGRFLYVAKPDVNGFTEIDFNKAFNPPCAFTQFATCPLPPKQNILPIAIEAGEKFSGKH